MKKGLIVFLVFAVVLVIGLLITGVFGKAEANTATLKVNATNTTIVVRDDQDQVISNDNGVLIIGNTYTVTVTPYDDCILQYLTINDINYFKKIENNQCSFECNGNVSIKAISVIDPTLEDPPFTGIAEVYSVTYSACAVAGPGFSVRNVNDVTLILYDSTNSIVTRLGVGETFDLLVENEKYTIKYSSDTAYKNIRITNTAIDLKYHTFPYTFTAKANSNLRVTSFNSIAFNIIPQSVFNVGEQEQTGEFVAGETYTLSDNAPEGFKTNLYVNNQLVQLPYTFTYSEDMTFDFELVEEEVEYTTTTYQFSNIESITLSKRDGTGEEIHLDVSTGTASVQLELGTDYNYEIVATAEYVITSTIYNGSDFLRNPTPAISGHLTIVENGVYQINTQQSNAGIYLNLALPNNSNGYISYTIGIYDPELGSQVDTRSVVVTSQSAPTSVYVDLNAYAGYGLTFDAAWVANGTSNSEPLLIAFADNPDFVNTLYGNNIAANSFPVYNMIFDENSAAGAA